MDQQIQEVSENTPEISRETQIREIVLRHRGAHYPYFRLRNRVNDHVDRGYTLAQVEEYESVMAATGNSTRALEAGNNLRQVASTTSDALDAIAYSLAGLPPSEEILPSDPRYNELASEIILRYRYRGEPEGLATKVRDHRRENLSIRQVERYEAHYNQYNNFGAALRFARETTTIPSEWLRDPLKRVEPKPLDWRIALLQNLYPYGVPVKLMKKVPLLADKAAVLKAVFKYNNPRTPRKVRERKPHAKFLLRLLAHNSEDHHADYIHRLENFFRSVKNRSGHDMVHFVANHKEIVQAIPGDTGVLTHSLFKVEKCEGDRLTASGRLKTNDGFKLIVTTRNDVYYTHLNQRMNFGKLSFVVNLRDQTITSFKRPENFKDNACPYISNEKVCMGSNQHSIMKNFKAGNLSEALTELYLTMVQFNPDSTPYEGLDKFFSRAHMGELLRNNGEQPEIEVIT